MDNRIQHSAMDAHIVEDTCHDAVAVAVDETLAWFVASVSRNNPCLLQHETHNLWSCTCACSKMPWLDPLQYCNPCDDTSVVHTCQIPLAGDRSPRHRNYGRYRTFQTICEFVYIFVRRSSALCICRSSTQMKFDNHQIDTWAAAAVSHTVLHCVDDQQSCSCASRYRYINTTSINTHVVSIIHDLCIYVPSE